MLYLLESCYPAPTTTLRAGKEGKELIAATSLEKSVVPAPGSSSFTSRIIRALNHAAEGDQHRLTAALLWSRLLNDAHEGKLEYIPFHSEVRVGHQALRTSILLAPVINKGHASIKPSPSSPLTNTTTTTTPLGSQRTDLRVLLSVHLSSIPTALTMQELKNWVPTQRPHGMGISIEYTAPSSPASSVLVFVMSGPAYYCLASHEAVRFLGFVKGLGV